jgi:hypothetical protein
MGVPFVSVALALGSALSGCRRAVVDGDGERATQSESAVIRTVDPASDVLARAREVCHVVQGAPAERRAACCGGRPSGNLEEECVRALSTALAAGRIELDRSQLSRCSEASTRALEGCDWVTPGQPMPPEECRDLTRGRVAAGDVCRSSLECVSPLHCEGSTPTQGGRCAAPRPTGAACRAASDGLASYLFERQLEREHPSCSGACSLVTHRCEPGAPPPEAAPSARRGPGEACVSDFDCSAGGCNGAPGTCGMKCAVSLADRARFGAAPLALPRRSPAQK